MAKRSASGALPSDEKKQPAPAEQKHAGKVAEAISPQPKDAAPDEEPGAKPKASAKMKSDLIESVYTGTAEISVQESSWVRDTQIKPYNPDPLVQKSWDYKIYEEMLEDDQINVALQLKKDLVIGSGWTIHADEEQAEIKDCIEEALLDKADRPFSVILEEILQAYEFGFSVGEKIFKLDDEGKLALRDIKVRHPGTWVLHTDKHGNMTRYEQRGRNESLDINPDSLVHYINNPRHQNPYGKSDLAAAYQAYMTKRHITRFYAIFLEKAASPTPVASYDRRAPQAAVDDVYQALKKFQTRTALAIPKEIELQFLESKNSGEAYIKGINLFNMFIGRALFIPDLLGFQGAETTGGAQALGREQVGVFYRHIDKRRVQLERIVNQHVIRALVLYNFGPQEKFPQFRFNPLSDEDVMRYADLWIKAIQGKNWVPTPEEINHFRDLVKFPKSDDMQMLAPMPGMENVPHGTNDAEGKDGEYEQPADEAAAGTAAPGTPQMGTQKPIQPVGAPGTAGASKAGPKAQDQALNGGQISSLVDIVSRVAKGEIPRDAAVGIIQVGFLVSRAQAEAILGTAGNGFEPTKPEPPPFMKGKENEEGDPEGDDDPDGPKGGGIRPDSGAKKEASDDAEGKGKKPFAFQETPGEYAKKVDFKKADELLTSTAEAIMREAQPVIADIFEDLYDQIQRKKIIETKNLEKANSIDLKFLKRLQMVLKKNFRKLYMEGKREAVKELKGRGEFAEPLAADEFLQFLDQESFRFIGEWEYRVTSTAKTQIIAAIKDGRPLSEVISIMDNEGVKLAETSLERYARTKTTEVYNKGRKEFFESSGVVEAYQFSAILDGVTSEICAGLHGTIFSKDEAPIPPLHFNCRSLLVPITKFEDYEVTRRANDSDETEINEFIDQNLGDGFSRK